MAEIALRPEVYRQLMIANGYVELAFGNWIHRDKLKLKIKGRMCD